MSILFLKILNFIVLSKYYLIYTVFYLLMLICYNKLLSINFTITILFLLEGNYENR